MNTLDQYDNFVEERWFSTIDAFRTDCSIATLGLNGEAGEVAEKIKKWLRGDIAAGVKTLDQHRREVENELGDVLFYLTKLAHLHKCTLNDIAIANVNKLNGRAARGTNRGDGDER